MSEDSKTYSVNELLDALPALFGQAVRVACLLNVEFEGNALLHIPKSERHEGPYEVPFYCSHPTPALIAKINQLKGRRVLVTCVVNRPPLGDLGHERAEVDISAVEKLGG